MTEAEWVDVVDLSDVVVGAAPRPLLRDGGLNHRVVHVFVSNRAGELLLQRPAGEKAARFVYGSSVAGHVLRGESYAQAARREFEEELGVRAPELQGAGKTWLDEGNRRKFIGVFTAHADGPFDPDPTEVAGLEFLPTRDVRRRLRRSGTFSETFARVFAHVDAERAWPV
jgi:isopentenyldiphosphate isomerase